MLGGPPATVVGTGAVTRGLVRIIGKGLERITVNQEAAQPVFEDVARTLEEEAKPVLEALAALGQ